MPDPSADHPRSATTRPQSIRSGTSDMLSPTSSNAAPSPILKGSVGWEKSPSGGGLTKAVSIAEPDSISPLMRGKWKEVPPENNGELFNLDRVVSSSSMSKHRSAKVATRRLSGRPSGSTESFSKHLRQPSLSDRASIDTSGYESSATATSHKDHHKHGHEGLLHQVTAWIKQEKARRSKSKKKRKHREKDGYHVERDRDLTPRARATSHNRRDSSESSDGEAALDMLQEILDKNLAITAIPHSASTSSLPRRKASVMKLRRQSTAYSSDGEHPDVDLSVPHADVYLDNSKTLAYGSVTGESNIPGEGGRPPLIRLASTKDAWRTFQFEIVRLTHTLRIKGWRRVPMELSHNIEVERLSGALTNAVYVVSPPRELPSTTQDPAHGGEAPRKPPPKLLLRIYGMNVSHLIDRESELAILRRLSKKNIGPKMLGTFSNGRFEEFFNAITLTARDIRDPDMSRQIAKRMRELHDGIDLLKSEREAGPFVFQNVDKWFARCEKLVTWLDAQVDKHAAYVKESKSSEATSKYVCVTPWPLFKQTLQKYRTWLNEQYGSYERVKDGLVFAHNDAQYGNILRLVPSETSPLLLPKNAHKQLVVIDFEYANANLPALEFANHFSEWCYNYHDAERPWRCNARVYPTAEEQARFIRSYLTHVSPFQHNGPGKETQSEPDTPNLMPAAGSISSSLISMYMLDMRNPLGSAGNSLTNLASLAASNMPSLPRVQEQFGLGNKSAVDRAPAAEPSSSTNTGTAARPIMAPKHSSYMPTLSLSPTADNATDSAQEEQREEELRRQVDSLMWETRLWRIANSTMWTMWGVMQAKIEGLPKELMDDDDNTQDPESEGLDTPIAGVLNMRDLNDDPLKKLELRKEEENVAREDGGGDRKPEGTEQAGGEEEEEADEFDYLAYARDRALFFWGDCVSLGLVEREELPEGVRREIKVVEY